MDRFRAWLARMPGRDAVERRQAYLLQAFLLILCTAFVVAEVSNAAAVLTTGDQRDLVANGVVAVVLLALVAVLRRGQFRIVTGVAIGFLTYAVGQALAVAQPGLAGSYLALLLVPLVLGGLLLPRLGLLATLVAVVAAGLVGRNLNPAATSAGLTEASTTFVFAAVLVASMVDQFGGTVRKAFHNAVNREHQLEVARNDLQVRTDELQTAVAALETEMGERQRAEAERRAMEVRVLEMQKLESLGVLAGGIAHDFNNLLVGIMGNAGLAMMETQPGTEVHDRIGQIEIASRRASDLARQMLAYSGKGTFIVAPVDLSALVREMTQLLDVSIGKSVSIRYALADEPVVIEADATQLRQVVMNLVVNASDAIGDGAGTITVATSRVSVDREYLAGTFVDEGLAAGDYAVLDVSDTGAGMDAATRSRIFDPFFTTKTSGRGLGLAAVLGIVRAHKGALKVYSEAGHGSTFKLLLPLTRAGVVPDAWAMRPTKPWQGEGTILVVDDEPMVRDVATAILKRAGLTVVTAEDGSEAVEVFAAAPERFALVLVDLTMPGLTGAETLGRIHDIRPDVPVVVMSGYNEEEASGRFEGRELAGFLEKPFSTGALTSVVQRALGAEPGDQPDS